MYTNNGPTPKPDIIIIIIIIIIILCCRVLYFFKNALFSFTLRMLNLHNRSQKIFAFHIFGLKCCLHPSLP